MDAVTYKLEQFEGPLDLLLSLIHKNKVSISDIPISLICDQYLEYLSAADELNMDVASEFIVMASELMVIKSKMLLPKEEKDEEDPRAPLADALVRYQHAKEAAQKLNPLYAFYSGRMVKDTDEISIDKTYVHDQDVADLCTAVRRIITYNNALEKAANTTFTPMISKPIIPVEVKIVSIIKKAKVRGRASLYQLLDGEATLPDIIACFLGVLELIKVRKLLVLEEDPDETNALLGARTLFFLNEEADTEPQTEETDAKEKED